MGQTVYPIAGGFTAISLVDTTLGWGVTNNGEILRYNRTVTTGVRVEEKKVAPSEFVLLQNYPNPFNPTTEIRYQIPEVRGKQSEVSRVTLRVFDILGREVATLVDEVQEAGFKSVQWNASGVASGVYFYRLQAGGFAETRKLVVLR
jgi:hypothetical protein